MEKKFSDEKLLDVFKNLKDKFLISLSSLIRQNDQINMFKFFKSRAVGPSVPLPEVIVEDMKLSVKLNEGAIAPAYAHKTDAGMDLFSTKDTGVIINPGARALISTGVSVAVPNGYVGLIWDKSGLAAKQGISVMGGVIDSGYRGEIMVLIHNSGNDIVSIGGNQKVAQLLIQPIESAEIELVDTLPEASDERGMGGFGSTGLSAKQ